MFLKINTKEYKSGIIINTDNISLVYPTRVGNNYVVKIRINDKANSNITVFESLFEQQRDIFLNNMSNLLEAKVYTF